MCSRRSKATVLSRKDNNVNESRIFNLPSPRTIHFTNKHKVKQQNSNAYSLKGEPLINKLLFNYLFPSVFNILLTT